MLDVSHPGELVGSRGANCIITLGERERHAFYLNSIRSFAAHFADSGAKILIRSG